MPAMRNKIGMSAFLRKQGPIKYWMPVFTGMTVLTCCSRIAPLLTMRTVKLLICTLLLALAFAPAIARAALTIEIIGAGANQIPIAIVPFRAENGLSQQITPVIAADLARSGLFRTVDAGGVNPLPTVPAEVNFGTWTARGAEALVIGNVIAQPDGR